MAEKKGLGCLFGALVCVPILDQTLTSVEVDQKTVIWVIFVAANTSFMLSSKSNFGRWQAVIWTFFLALKLNQTGCCKSESIVGECCPVATVCVEEKLFSCQGLLWTELIFASNLLRAPRGSSVSGTVEAAQWVPVLNNELYLINRRLEAVLT